MAWIFLGGLLVTWPVVRWANGLARPAHRLGVTEGRLAPCGSRPNCVASAAANPQQRLEPEPFSGSVDEAMTRLRAAVAAEPRSRLVRGETDYLHAEFRSRWLAFVDDLEFYIDERSHQIHFRSASRVGHSDLGVNRERLERILAAFRHAGETDSLPAAYRSR